RSTKAAVHGLQAVMSTPKNPIVGSFPDCCARALSGHVAALPRSVMNSRRLIAFPEAQDQRIVAAQTSTLEASDVEVSQCPLWVISGHMQCKQPCPLHPQSRPRKRTSANRQVCFTPQKQTCAAHKLTSALGH